MEDLIYIIRKDKSGGILGYSQKSFDANDMARHEYRLATPEEIGTYFEIQPVEDAKEEIEDSEKISKKKLKVVNDEL